MITDFIKRKIMEQKFKDYKADDFWFYDFDIAEFKGNILTEDEICYLYCKLKHEFADRFNMAENSIKSEIIKIERDLTEAENALRKKKILSNYEKYVLMSIEKTKLWRETNIRQLVIKTYLQCEYDEKKGYVLPKDSMLFYKTHIKNLKLFYHEYFGKE